MATDASIRKLGELSTCDVADALIKAGSLSGGYLHSLQVFSPSLLTPELANFRLCGPAFTVLFIPAEHAYAGPPPPLHHIDAAPSGCVMVLQAPEGATNAVWGGLMSTGAKAQGVKGAVIDGNCRDILEHREMGFPVIARGHSILGSSPFVRPAAHQIPLTFPAAQSLSPGHDSSTPTPSSIVPKLASTIVHPGDIILADIDGVVVVPADMIERVVRLATEGKARDELIKADLEAGMGVKETMKKYRG